MRLIVTDNHKNQKLKDQRLIDHMSKAYQWLTINTFGKAQSVKEIADTDVLDQSHVTRSINKDFFSIGHNSRHFKWHSTNASHT